MKKFLEFVRTQGVAGLAIAFILGVAINDLVKSLIDNIINPLIGILLNQAQGLTSATFVLLGATIKYGALINTLINFIVICLVVYIAVRNFNLDKIDTKK